MLFLDVSNEIFAVHISFLRVFRLSLLDHHFHYKLLLVESLSDAEFWASSALNPLRKENVELHVTQFLACPDEIR